MPVQADKTNDLSLIAMLERETGQSVFLINRLDRPASGIVLFSKTRTMAATLSQMLKERKIEKTYLAVVGEKPDPPSGKLVHYLRKDGRSNRSFAFDKPLHHTKEAILEYQLMASIERYHLLKILLITGRHHQVRAQLSAIGNPVKGDVKYGFRRGNRDRSIDLHGWRMQFTHPVTGKMLTVEAPVPQNTVWDNLT